MATAEYITSKTMTRLNPDGITYRLPLDRSGTMRIEGDGGRMAAFGDAVDKLGQIEALGFSMKELRELAVQHGKTEI